MYRYMYAPHTTCRFAGHAVDILPGSGQMGICLVQFCDWSSTAWALQWHLQKKERNGKSVSDPSRLFTLWFCHRPSRLCGEKSLLRFCPFPNETGLNPLPPSRLRLETNYDLMIWSLTPPIVVLLKVMWLAKKWRLLRTTNGLMIVCWLQWCTYFTAGVLPSFGWFLLCWCFLLSSPFSS